MIVQDFLFDPKALIVRPKLFFLNFVTAASPQPNNKEFTQRKRQQQLLTCNTPSSKGCKWYFITYSVLTEKKH